MRCPVCGSENTEKVKYRNIECVVCNNCGFDERDEMEMIPEERSRQAGKSGYTPYKTGGAQRTRKK